jgi:hypothetical protein
LGAQALKLTNSLRAIETQGVDSLLDHFGLQRREGALGPAVWFAAGALTAGAIIFFLLAPESSKKLRDRIAQLWESRARRKPSRYGGRACHCRDLGHPRRVDPEGHAARRSSWWSPLRTGSATMAPVRLDVDRIPVGET